MIASRNQRRGFFSRLRRLNHASELTMHIYKLSKMADKYAGDPVISHLSTAVMHLDLARDLLQQTELFPRKNHSTTVTGEAL